MGPDHCDLGENLDSFTDRENAIARRLDLVWKGAST
jgi:hypothetical protein